MNGELCVAKLTHTSELFIAMFIEIYELLSLEMMLRLGNINMLLDVVWRHVLVSRVIYFKLFSEAENVKFPQ